MQLFIMRHGEAQNFNEQNIHDDSQRALTNQGKQEAQVMASWLQKTHTSPIKVLVSPYIRAQQTCEIVTSRVNAVITTLDFITPSGDAKQVHDYIDGYCNDNHSDIGQSILIVSHMPLVSYLVAELTQYANAPIFATAGIAHINYDVEKMQGELLGLVSPLDLC
jgi:phosphohistidine phosphatase